MGILMAGLSPHPPLIIPEIGGEERLKVSTTIDSIEELSREIKESDPELIITISPHGPVLKNAISTMDIDEIYGDFGDFGHPEVSFKVKSNLEFIKKLRKEAGIFDIKVIDLLSDQFKIYDFQPELDHGVMVPLYFLQKAGVDVPLVPLNMGLLSYERLYEFGTIIQETLDKMGIDAVIIASGDLSHRLKPGAPAGFNPRGQEFDQKLVDALGSEDYEEILNMDPGLIQKAGECGLRPVIILLGALKGLKTKTEVKSYEGTFGVGYAIVGIYRRED